MYFLNEAVLDKNYDKEEMKQIQEAISTGMKEAISKLSIKVKFINNKINLNKFGKVKVSKGQITSHKILSKQDKNIIIESVKNNLMKNKLKVNNLKFDYTPAGINFVYLFYFTLSKKA